MVNCKLVIIVPLAILAGCATVSEKPVEVEAPVSKPEQIAAQKELSIPEAKSYKRKIAIARFTNETNYGRSLMSDEDLDRIGKQASDMLASRLIKSGKFLVFERPDLKKIEREQNLAGDSKLIGVDVLIVGSVTEFGRSVGGKRGFLSKTKVQSAHAKVDIRLVDVHTGHAFFSAVGAGEASTESGAIAGFGSYAAYDATLNDRAIAAAISDMIDKLISTLEERPWRTEILEIQDKQIYISGGERQGLEVGDVLQVMEPGQTVDSKRTGFPIELPPKQIATLRVVSLFGDSEINEGSVCELTAGNIPEAEIKKLYVTEVGEK
ncbi:MAG: curli production assembly protein CsgG [Deltaproteobacteria bacterium]|nr:MAG: curli production assembly protein CsgG [Deltaproteobacteria bacterium]